ncbi:MAG: MerR family transcriptional regulator [Turicibacter sp.]
MTITEVSKKFELTPDTLRYYERIGLIPRVNRKSNGVRDYSEQDCRWIEFIKCMRGAGLQIEVLIEFVSLFQQGDQTAPARKAILIDQRDQLVLRINDQQKTLDKLNQKIERYEELVTRAENKLNGMSS